ncbi:MAG: prepilin peptidase [Candidatus Bipolaricaulia bacterium]
MKEEWIPVLLMVVVAAGIDIRHRLIPNWLTLPGFLGGLVWHLARTGGQGLLFAMGGAILASVVFLIPFLRGGIGGGDFKLLLALGSFLGPWQGLRAAVAVAIVGGIMSLAFLLGRKAGNGRSEGPDEARARRSEESRPAGERRDQEGIPYGPAIAMGTAWAIFAA